MLKPSAFRPRHVNSGRPAHKSALGYLQWLRGRPCAIAGREGHVCEGKVRACHYDPLGDKGMGTRASDRGAVPMCDGCHTEQTDRLGWPDFEAKYRFNARVAGEDYWRAWPGRGAWERKQGAMG